MMTHAEHCQCIVDIPFSTAPLPSYKAYSYATEDKTCAKRHQLVADHSPRGAVNLPLQPPSDFEHSSAKERT